ncbi:MAG: ASKHA domain-containing protein [Lachnospiraceae bacterium]|nr:ASKHA domain-containing protein [Lachnospiraceae bacterium]
MDDKIRGITRKLYLELTPPTEEDNRSAQRRILDALEAKMDSEATGMPKNTGLSEDTGRMKIKIPLHILRNLHSFCQDADWKLTASLAWDGCCWQVVALEAGDTSHAHYGLAVDLGSTTVVMQLVDCESGEVVAQESACNRQIAFGEDILTRIFYSKDQPERLEEIRRATVDTIVELMEELGIDASDEADTYTETNRPVTLSAHVEKENRGSVVRCISMVVAGNTTMTHFLLGMDAFCVFSTPYAVQADQPGFLKGAELGIPIPGYVFCYPGKANYLGGDIISGMVATDIYRKDTISLFFDVGTNGELVVGNREFLLYGAGAAGPALEGGVVKTGMRAAEGAVQHVKLVETAENAEKTMEMDGSELVRIKVKEGAAEKQYRVLTDVIGGETPKGICGSGIIDLISELFLHGILDLRGKLVPEASDAVVWCAGSQNSNEDAAECDASAAGCCGSDAARQDGEYAFQYAPGLYFYQSDIHEFIRTKAAAYTMMGYLLSETGMSLDDVRDFYMAGAFGSHVDVTSAVNIGMYPDVDPERIHPVGNTSLEGARRLLLDRSVAEELPEILDLMTYVQFGAVEDFLEKMTAASALPHTDLERYPSVKARLNKMFKK